MPVLGEGEAGALGGISFEHVEETLPLPDFRRLVAQHIGHERRDVHEAYHFVPPARRSSRAVDDEGDVQHLLEIGVPVARSAVFPKLLAVIGGDEDQGVLPPPGLGQAIEEDAHPVIHVVKRLVVDRDHALPVGLVESGQEFGVLEVLEAPGQGDSRCYFARVVRAEASQMALGGIVAVYVVGMEEHEERVVALLPYPGQAFGHALLDVLEALTIGLEALGEAELAGHHARFEEAGRGEPPVAQKLGQGDHRVVDTTGSVERAEVHHRRVERGEEGGVGGRGPGRLAPAPGEDHALIREAIEVGGGDPVVAVAPKVIRAQGVDGHEDHVAGAFGGLRDVHRFGRGFDRPGSSGSVAGEE